MCRKMVLMVSAAAVLLAGCEGQGVGGFAKEHKVGLIGAGVGAGVGALAGQAVGHNTSSTLLGAAVGGGIGYLLGNTQDKKRAEQYNPATTTPLTGSQWRVNQPFDCIPQSDRSHECAVCIGEKPRIRTRGSKS